MASQILYFGGVIHHHFLPVILEIYKTVVQRNSTESMKLYYMCFTIKNNPLLVLLKLQEQNERES